MHTGEQIPVIFEDATISEALVEMSAKGLDMTAIVDSKHRISGIFTDGDLRRTPDQGLDLHKSPVTSVMTPDCISTSPDKLAAEALKLMQDKKINALLVVDEQNQLAGALNMHDLLRAGVV